MNLPNEIGYTNARPSPHPPLPRLHGGQAHRQHLETRTDALDTLHTLLAHCLEQKQQRGHGTLICNCNREEIRHEMHCTTDAAAVFRLCTTLKISRIEFSNSAKHFYLQEDSPDSNLLVCQNCVSHSGECAECELPGGWGIRVVD